MRCACVRFRYSAASALKLQLVTLGKTASMELWIMDARGNTDMAPALELKRGNADLEAVHGGSDEGASEDGEGWNHHAKTHRAQLLPRNADMRTSLPAQRTLTTYGPQANRTGAALQGPLGPASTKKNRRSGFFFALRDRKAF